MGTGNLKPCYLYVLHETEYTPFTSANRLHWCLADIIILTGFVPGKFVASSHTTK